MNPQLLLLANFDRMSDGPNAIPRLRRFVLDLAIRGKLVEQDSRDEPASELLKRIKSDKTEIAKDRGMRAEKPLPSLGEDSLPFHVPKHWCWSQLAEVGFLNPRNTADDGLRVSFVPMPHISAEYGIAHTHEVRRWEEIKSGYTHFAEGDVALAKITPCFENGKSTVFRDLTGGIGAGTTELHVVRPVIVSAEYILIFLKSPHFIKSGIPRMTGTAGQKRVPSEYFGYSAFPLPPLAEQHRIVSKVDELMTLCDRLEATQTEQGSRRTRLVAATLHHLNNAENAQVFHNHARFYLTHLPRLTSHSEQINELRQAILKLAVRGKLVRQNPSDEAASKLIQGIQEEKERLEAQGIFRKSKPLPPVGVDEMPFPLPRLWEWCRLRLLVFSLGDGLHGTPEYVDGTDYHFINGNNLVDGTIVIKPNTKTVSFDEMQKHKKLLSSNAVLVSINGTLGNVAFYNNEQIVLGKSACYFNLSESIDKRYVKLVIESQYFIDYAMENATGTTIKNLSLKAMNEFPVPLPPEAEQRRIVAKVDELMTLCDRLEIQLVTAQTESCRLLDAILHEALN